MIEAVNSTAVRLSWSGSSHLSTFVQYTVYCSETESVMGQSILSYPPQTVSSTIVLDDAITLSDTYMHNFTLYYSRMNDNASNILAPTSVNFKFGM